MLVFRIGPHARVGAVPTIGACLVLAFCSATAYAVPPHAAVSSLETVPHRSTQRAAAMAPLTSIVQEIGMRSFRDAYAGISGAANGRLTIYVAKDRSGNFLSQVEARTGLMPGRDYTVVHVQHSWMELNSLTLEIANDGTALRHRGIYLTQWGPDSSSNRVEIRLRSYSDDLERTLLDRYGAEWVTVDHTSDPEVYHFADRNHDVSPFWGGVSIFPNKSSPGVFCTAGLNMIGTVQVCPS
jgi:hypothetical protein